jgi:formylglycine-generating enzyme required for sulfatase activity
MSPPSGWDPERRDWHQGARVAQAEPVRHTEDQMLRSHPTRPRLLSGALAALLVTACSGGTVATAPASGAGETTGPTPTQPAPTVGPTPTEVGPPQPSPQRDPGTVRQDEHGVDQVWVPGGTFTMGSDAGSATGPAWTRRGFASEHPAHEVRVTRGYWIDVTEVTNEAYQAFVDDGGYDDASVWSEEGRAWLEGMGPATLPRQCILDPEPTAPRVCITWYEAEAYAAWRGGRLPTEAEWEFAARGPDSSVYPWGDTFDPALANLDGSLGPKPVGSYPEGASWVGALDMAGNAMEWVADWWSTTYYGDAPTDDPTGPEDGTIKVEKGGWWGPPDDAGAFISRSSYRHFEDPPVYSDHHIGFRVVTLD